VAFELDDQDLNILTHLLRDCRAPAAQIADRIGLSRPAVADRIEKLERNGIIRGHTVVVDPVAVGRPITAFIAARGPSKLAAKAWEAFRQLMNSDEIVEVHTVAGEDCYFVKVRTASIGSLNELVSRLTAAPISLSTRTTIVMQTHCEKIGGINLGEGP